MEHPFFYIVFTLGVLAAMGIIGVILSFLLKDKEQTPVQDRR
jgi:uncharacterized membrane protein